jgi:hypothetical protein
MCVSSGKEACKLGWMIYVGVLRLFNDCEGSVKLCALPTNSSVFFTLCASQVHSTIKQEYLLRTSCSRLQGSD